MRSRTCGGHHLRLNVPNELDPFLQPTRLPHLLQLDHLGSVAADHEPDVGEQPADVGGGGDQEVDTFAVDEPCDDDDRYYRTARRVDMSDGGVG